MFGLITLRTAPNTARGGGGMKPKARQRGRKQTALTHTHRQEPGHESCTVLPLPRSNAPKLCLNQITPEQMAPLGLAKTDAHMWQASSVRALGWERRSAFRVNGNPGLARSWGLRETDTFGGAEGGLHHEAQSRASQEPGLPPAAGRTILGTFQRETGSPGADTQPHPHLAPLGSAGM